MKGHTKVKSTLLYSLLLSGLFLTSCLHFTEPTQTIKYYANPEISSYQVKKIAQLPLLPDDSTNYGAYFATNHLYNILDQHYPSIILADIDWIRDFDCSFVNEQINSIKVTSRIDIQTFNQSRPGYDLIEDGYDAVIIGTIDSLNISFVFIASSGNYFPVYGWRTFCKFTYYFVSLKDGRILWNAEVYGEEVFEIKNFYIKEFPPLDYAISNGIDRMIDVLPSSIFKSD